MLKLRAEKLRLTIGLVPVPERVTDCWLPATLPLLSVITNDAERLKIAVGVNVTLMVQLPPAARELPQVLVCPKSPALVPVNPMLLMERARLPVLLSVTVWAVLVVLRV